MLVFPTPLYANWRDNIISVDDKIRMRAAKSGRFIIHEFPSGMMTPRMLRKLIEMYRNRGLIFDLVAVDYANIMAPDYRGTMLLGNSENLPWSPAIAFEFDCALLTATQSNREGVKAICGQGRACGGRLQQNPYGRLGDFNQRNRRGTQ